MDLNEAMERRHSVRMYSDEPVSQNLLNDIAVEVKRCNAASDLHFQMAAGLDDAFCGHKTHYGRFTGVHNAIALVAKINEPYDLHPKKKPADVNSAEIADPVPAAEAATEEKVGYYGEQLALTLVGLGLDCSWAVLDDASNGWWELDSGERMVWVIAFGHAARAGAKHHSKPLDSLCALPANLGKNGEAPTLDDAPEWFQRGIEAASLAPTSLSQQPFRFTLESGQTDSHGAAVAAERANSQCATDDLEPSEGEPLPHVSACATPGLFAHVGLGCAKRHFEIGAGTGNFEWA
ncbi:nitroreductase family protein [Bifidobacterium sp. ESL0763]|uniref:nitroreductase family protein n=1 Tax=Bifidobacterium sp. ESL0763 TaxID=2983227 RepID=UPI0023F7B18F|nr:nitroreductase family protein [Bifidobacterium sp. ESL0763]MDF7663170.1 nitroreductase family protein [Bifidobacterium sp. ESL0763]